MFLSVSTKHFTPSTLHFTGTTDATGLNFAVAFQANIVSGTVNIDQIELYISALQEGTVVNVTSPAYTGTGAPQVSFHT